MSTTETWSPIKEQLSTLNTQIDALGEQISSARRQAGEFRLNPVAGKFLGLKRWVYRLINSSFTKQYEQNERVLEILSDLHAGLRQQQAMLETMERTPAHGDSLPAACAPEAETPVEGTAALQSRIPGFLRVFNHVAQLVWPERALLYSLLYGLKPRRMLEIGTAQGGSALITCGAMDDNGFGSLYCVDLKFQVSERDWSLIRHRTTFFQGPSPETVATAAAAAGAGFDFAFIDGDHTYEGLLRDIKGVLPHMADQSYLLFHDSHHAAVKQAIDESLDTFPELMDCGELSTQQVVHDVPNWGVNLWGGLRLLRLRRGCAQARSNQERS